MDPAFRQSKQNISGQRRVDALHFIDYIYLSQSSQCIQIFVWRFSELYRKTVIASVRCVRHIKETKFQISQTFTACMMPSSASITADRLGFAILPTRTARPKGGSLRRDNFAFFGRHNSETCVCITTGKNGERLDFSFLYGN